MPQKSTAVSKKPNIQTRLGKFWPQKPKFRTRKWPNFDLKNPIFRTTLWWSFQAPGSYTKGNSEVRGFEAKILRFSTPEGRKEGRYITAEVPIRNKQALFGIRGLGAKILQPFEAVSGRFGVGLRGPT